jgi:hypothetical protein
MCTKRFRLGEEELVKRVWGDNLCTAETNRWQTTSHDRERKRVKGRFVQIVKYLLYSVFETIMTDEWEVL